MQGTSRYSDKNWYNRCAKGVLQIAMVDVETAPQKFGLCKEL
jgi:hypothetical protein